MRGGKTGIVAILTVGLLAASMVGVSAQDPATESPQGEPGLDVRELEWAPLDLDEAAFGPAAHIVDIAASDSMLVIGGSVGSSAAVWTSTDRMTWERVPHEEAVFGGPGDQEIKAIVPWRDGFVAAGEVGGVRDFDPRRVAVVWFSEDGTTWARVPHDEKVFGGRGRQEMFDIAASDDRLVIVGFDEEGPCCTDAGANHDIAVWTSTDGLAWTQDTFGGGEMLAVAGTSEGFVGVGHRGMWTSPDGLQWEREDPGDLRYATLLGVAPTPSGFVAVGLDSPHGERAGAWTSSDGTDWTPAEIAASLSDDEFWMPQDVALARSGLAQVVGPSRYGDETSTILVSEDGRSWVPGVTRTGVSDARLRDVAGYGDHFVAIGSSQDPWEQGQAGVWTTLEPSELSSEAESTAEPVERDTTVAPDLLPGVDLVTEEVGFGAYRVLGDGVRDLSKQVHDVVVTPEGDVWIETGTSRNWSLIRLGDPSVSKKLGRQQTWTLSLTSDGAPAARSQSGDVRVFDGEAWRKAELTAYDRCVPPHSDPGADGAAVGADGGCWRGDIFSVEPRPSDTALVRLNADGTRTEPTRAEVGLEPDQHAHSPAVGPDGTIWVEVYGMSQDETEFFDGLLAYDGSTWSSIPYDGDEYSVWDSEIAVDRDGVVWISGTGHGRAILSWDGESWVSQMTAGHTDGFENGWFKVRPIRPWPNGVVWFGNVARWDGSDLEVFEQPADPPPRPPIYGPVATAPDGSAWTIMKEQLYVITPEAVAATE